MEPRLELIIPHYREPMHLCYQMLDVLILQRGLQPGIFRVIMVHDGEENAFADDAFDWCPFEVEQISIPHGGVSSARNAGLRAATAEWIMFCDFDDAFASTMAIWLYLQCADRNPGARMVVCPFFQEGVKPGGEWRYQRLTGEDRVFIHGKMMRRQWLIEHALWFNEDLYLHEDSAMMTVVWSLLGDGEIARLPDSVYIWQHNPNSLTREEGDFVLRTFESWCRKTTVMLQDLWDRGMFAALKAHLCAAVCEGVVNFWRISWRNPDMSNRYADAMRLFLDLVNRHMEMVETIRDETIRKSLCAFIDLFNQAGDLPDVTPEDMYVDGSFRLPELEIRIKGNDP